MAEEEISASESTAAVVEEPTASVPSDHKRKHQDLDSDESPNPDASNPTSTESPETKEPAADSNGVEKPTNEEPSKDDQLPEAPDAKRPRLDEEIDGSDSDASKQEEQKVDGAQVDGAQHQSSESTEQPPVEVTHESVATVEDDEQPVSDNGEQPESEVPQSGELPMSDNQQPTTAILQEGDLPANNNQQQQADLPPSGQAMTHKIEVPNNKVGVLIGKAGDTIRFLQYNSGARIQITRDADADPHSSTRPVELIGTVECINKAEQLIKDVIAEADAGGSPSLVARGFGTAQTGSEQVQIQVPYEKVGLIIGKGGETIKNLQTKSGARIQVILQNIPEGDSSKERTVRVTGNKNQIEAAREMIKEVLSQNPVRPSSLSGGYNQPAYRPRGPSGPPQWGPRAAPPSQPTNYGYQQRGPYQSQTTQYPPQTYGGYPQQGPRGNFNAGWDQRPSAPMQTPQSGGYNHYNQGSHGADGPASAAHIPAASAAALGSAHPTGPASAQVNYNYGQLHGYGQPNPYPQSMPPPQAYGHGYDNAKYENQALPQHGYGGHGNPQQGGYPQQGGADPGYTQQQYKQPAYGMPPQGSAPQSYGAPPRAGQPDVPYQGPVPSAQPYGPQQSYPYPSSGPMQQQQQQPYPYGQVPAANDGYTQPTSGAAPTQGYAPQGGPVAPGYGQQGAPVGPGYAQQGHPAPGYAQQGGQTAPAYAQQGVPPSGYGQYPSSQPGYGDQQAPNTANYGYQGATDATGYNMPVQAYGASASGQPSYPAANQPGYDQAAPQSGYGNAGTAPVSYGKSASPQPGYNQYEAGQMYGHH